MAITKRTRKLDEWVDDLLKRYKLAKPEEIETARLSAQADSAHIIDVVVEQNIVEEKELYQNISRDFSLPLIHPQQAKIRVDAKGLVDGQWNVGQRTLSHGTRSLPYRKRSGDQQERQHHPQQRQAKFSPVLPLHLDHLGWVL